MRTRLLVTAFALALAGCGGSTPGVDGDLANNWAATPDARVPHPPAAACYAVQLKDYPSELRRLPEPVECTAAHTTETVHVGAFSGTDAESATPPAIGGPTRRRAYEECAGATATLLGGDWRTGRLKLSLATPAPSHWEAGARWFRCDLVEYRDTRDVDVVSRTASLAGALPTVGLTCFAVDAHDTVVDAMRPVDCAEEHNAEFAGVYDAPDALYVDDDQQRRSLQSEGCRGVFAAYVAVPDDGQVYFRTGLIMGPFGKAHWELGNRGVRCYLYSAVPRTGSVKGAGSGALPVT